VLEAKEVKPLASFAQVHDPRLWLFSLKTDLGKDRRERPDGYDDLHWPHRDGLKWTHLASVVMPG
jgi:hypothetical protein